MIDLIDELKKDNKVYILLDTDEKFLFAEYKVTKIEYKVMNHQYAELTLINTPKKKRYFKKIIKMKGYRINFDYTPKKYKIFDDYEELIEYFCKKLKNNPENNPKLLNKFKNNYPNYFRNYISY